MGHFCLGVNYWIPTEVYYAVYSTVPILLIAFVPVAVTEQLLFDFSLDVIFLIAHGSLFNR